MAGDYKERLLKQCINCVHARPRHGGSVTPIILTCKHQKNKKNKIGRVEGGFICDEWEYRKEEK